MAAMSETSATWLTAPSIDRSMNATVHQWAQWISHTRLSVWLQHMVWVVPTSQSIHIVCVSIVFASALLISFRILGLSVSGRSVGQLVRTLAPWMYTALAVLLATGALQTLIEPRRQFGAQVFWIKMALIVVVVLLTTVFVRRVSHDPQRLDVRAKSSPLAKLFAVLSLALWVGHHFLRSVYRVHGDVNDFLNRLQGSALGTAIRGETGWDYLFPQFGDDSRHRIVGGVRLHSHG